MRRIDDETREVIADMAHEIEEGGWEVNRRALAREFDLSPQTVARILDGPKARRGRVGQPAGAIKQGPGHKTAIVAIVLVVAFIVVWMRGGGDGGLGHIRRS